MFAKAQSQMEVDIVRTPIRPHQPVLLYTGCAPNENIFANHEWGDG